MGYLVLDRSTIEVQHVYGYLLMALFSFPPYENIANTFRASAGPQIASFSLALSPLDFILSSPPTFLLSIPSISTSRSPHGHAYINSGPSPLSNHYFVGLLYATKLETTVDKGPYAPSARSSTLRASCILSYVRSTCTRKFCFRE